MAPAAVTHREGEKEILLRERETSTERRVKKKENNIERFIS